MPFEAAYGEVSTGAADDLQHATEIALQMVPGLAWTRRWASAPTHPRPSHSWGLRLAELKTSETTEREIDVAVRDIVTNAFEQATAILRTRRADFDEGGCLLLAQETLTADQFPAIRRLTKQPETLV